MRSPSTAAAELPKFPNPYDDSQPLEARVKAYLHVNCAICHQDAGGGNSAILLENVTPLANMRIVDEPPKHDKFGIADAKLIAPGDPQHSVLLHRISIRGKGQMPPLATTLVDDQAVALLRESIESLGKSE